MYAQRKWNFRITLVLFVGVLVAMACSLPGSSAELDSVQQTANALATSLVGDVPNAEEIQQTAESMAATTVAGTAEALIVEPPEVDPGLVETVVPDSADIPHELIPHEPSVSDEFIDDVDSGSTAGQKAAPGGDLYINGIYERPFTAEDMTYRPEVDVVKAELSSDGQYLYFTIHTKGLFPGSKEVMYGVELDTDFDGRGDYLLRTYAPTLTEWTIDNVQVFFDTNDDVGGPRAMRSDAPADSDGYNEMIFSVDRYADPDLAYSRQSPNIPNAVQLSIKVDSLDAPKSFMWGVFADAFALDAALWDHNDRYTLGDAGSPIAGDDAYPIKAFHSFDNTCRMVHGKLVTGSEPGLCGGAEVDVPDTSGVTVTVPVPINITPPSFP